jgi:hypothetical protein
MCRIYATPSVILRTSGSVGAALLMWLLGALIAAAGTAVYVELGTVRLFLNMNSLKPIFVAPGTPPKRWGEELFGIHL